MSSKKTNNLYFYFLLLSFIGFTHTKTQASLKTPPAFVNFAEIAVSTNTNTNLKTKSTTRAFMISNNNGSDENYLKSPIIKPKAEYLRVTVESCNETNCKKENGVCLDNNTCVCKEGYLNIPQFQSKPNSLCTYIQKKSYVAFMLELMMPLGFGHFYTGHYILGTSKFIFLVIIPIIFLILFNQKPNWFSKCIESSLILVWCVVATIIFLIDVAFYASGIHRDGNEIPLI